MTLHHPDLAERGRPVGSLSGDSLVARFEAMAAAAEVVAGMAAESVALEHAEIEAFLANLPDWQRRMAEGRIIDMSAVMEPGIATLLRLAARKLDTEIAARALCREYRILCRALVRMSASDGNSLIVA